jgi:hypothetical protein
LALGLTCNLTHLDPFTPVLIILHTCLPCHPSLGYQNNSACSNSPFLGRKSGYWDGGIRVIEI